MDSGLRETAAAVEETSTGVMPQDAMVQPIATSQSNTRQDKAKQRRTQEISDWLGASTPPDAAGYKDRARRPCKHGISCRTNHCKFLHPEGRQNPTGGVRKQGKTMQLLVPEAAKPIATETPVKEFTVSDARKVLEDLDPHTEKTLNDTRNILTLAESVKTFKKQKDGLYDDLYIASGVIVPEYNEQRMHGWAEHLLPEWMYWFFGFLYTSLPVAALINSDSERLTDKVSKNLFPPVEVDENPCEERVVVIDMPDDEAHKKYINAIWQEPFLRPRAQYPWRTAGKYAYILMMFLNVIHVVLKLTILPRLEYFGEFMMNYIIHHWKLLLGRRIMPTLEPYHYEPEVNIADAFWHAFMFAITAWVCKTIVGFAILKFMDEQDKSRLYFSRQTRISKHVQEQPLPRLNGYGRTRLVGLKWLDHPDALSEDALLPRGLCHKLAANLTRCHKEASRAQQVGSIVRGWCKDHNISGPLTTSYVLCAVNTLLPDKTPATI